MKVNKYPIAPEIPKSGTFLVTPEVAIVWLDRNSRNRALGPKRVNALAEEIREGRWVLSHQGIAFGPTGDLLDGQHRLAAIVASEIAVPLVVTVGVDPRALFVIDTGRQRSGADALRINGGASCSTTAAIAVLEVRVRGGGREHPVAPALIVEMVARYPEMEAAARTINGIGKRLNGWMPASCLAWWLWRARRVDPARAELFLEQVSTGQSIAAGDPAFALRSRLFNGVRAKTAGLTREQTLWMVCSAWSYFCAGKPLGTSVPPRVANPIVHLAGPGMGKLDEVAP